MTIRFPIARQGSVTTLAVTLAIALAAPTADGATLQLLVQGEQSQFQPGDQIVLRLRMEDVGPTPAAGFQAFLAYDDAVLTFVSATYTFAPFGQPVITPVVPDTGPAPAHLDLAASIDVAGGQTATLADATLVALTFDVDALVCIPPPIEFRTTTPPTRLTTLAGAEILPLALEAVSPPGCPEDLDGSGVVGFADLNQVLASWGPCPGCCTDFDTDTNVGFTDLNLLLSAWGPCD